MDSIFVAAGPKFLCTFPHHLTRAVSILRSLHYIRETMTPPKTKLLFTITEYINNKASVAIGVVKSAGAKRIFYPTTSGHIEGPALGRRKAGITPGGGDWVLVSMITV
jgi:hypothetical protein